jgi:hypothetical protein
VAPDGAPVFRVVLRATFLGPSVSGKANNQKSEEKEKYPKTAYQKSN